MSVHHTRLKLLVAPPIHSASPSKAIIDLSFLPARLQEAARRWSGFSAIDPEAGALVIHVDSRVIWGAGLACAVAALAMLVYTVFWGRQWWRRAAGRITGRAVATQCHPAAADSKAGPGWKRPVAWEESTGRFVGVHIGDAKVGEEDEDSDEDGGHERPISCFRAYSYASGSRSPLEMAGPPLPIRPAGTRSSSLPHVSSSSSLPSSSSSPRAMKRRRRSSIFAIPQLAMRKRRSTTVIGDEYVEEV